MSSIRQWPQRRAAWRLTGWVLAVVAAVALLGYVYFGYFTPMQLAVRSRLSEADSQSTAALQRRLQPLHDLFVHGKKGARPFAEQAISWSGKWALVKGMVWSADAHHQFLADAFGQHVFSPDELKSAMEGAVQAYLSDLDALENEMLVRLRADLADIGGASVAADLRSDQAFRAQYRKLADQVVRGMTIDFGVQAGREIGFFVAADVATQAALQASRTVAAEMGVEAGVLGTGAASAVETLGVGLVVAVLLDGVIDAAFKAAGYDPAAKIAEQVRASLDTMEAALTGEAQFFAGKKAGALRHHLETIHAARSKLRRQTIERFLNQGGGQ
jgi:hypothetical protein